MAICLYKLSRNTRFKLALGFTILNVIQIFIGVLTTGWSIYICLSVSKHLYSEKSEITFVFTVTGMYGTHIIFQYLIGIKICEKCFVKAHKRSTKRHLYFWLATCCNTIINIFILATMMVKISKHIVRSIRHSLEKGMRNYLRDPLWKHSIDRWQYSLQCCGVNNFKDWYEISWLDKYHIDIESPLVQSFLLSKDHLHLPVTPWSCCDYNFPMQCFHDPLQQIQFSHMWKEQPEFLDGTIYNKGCLEVLRTPIEASLVGFILLSTILIFNQIVIVGISRLLYTSCRNAVVLRDPFGDSPGWIFGRDCFVPIKGRTVSEILLDLNTVKFEDENKLKSKSSINNSNDSKPKEIKKRRFSKQIKSTADEVEQKKSNMKAGTRDSSPGGSEHNPISKGDEHALMLR